jgi:transposase-like protein
MNDAARRWREAAGLLSGDPTARVRCPSCGADFLVVAAADEGGARKLHLTCPRCLDRHVVERTS